MLICLTFVSLVLLASNNNMLDGIDVNESTKTDLLAFIQALRKVGFSYLKCCSEPIAVATNTTLYNNS